jgi:hypothetical protein
MSFLLAGVAAVVGVLLLAAGAVAIRASGANLSLGRRLAAARDVPVGQLLHMERPPSRPVRVVGRIRTADPIALPEGARLVAFHRDIEAAVRGSRWRTVERLRETRSFELWDHQGSLTFDPAGAAEPLVVIPEIWRGSVGELDESHRRAVQRLRPEGFADLPARAVTRTLNVVDRLRIVALATRSADGRTILAAPPGGCIITNLEPDEALRLLGGPRRRMIGPAVAATLVGAALLIAALGAAIGGLVAG